jgi:hypothetical protein
MIRRGLFADITGTGAINVRLVQQMIALVADYTDLTEAEKNQFLSILMMLANKLGAVWYHKERYKALEAGLVSKATAEPIESTAMQATIDCSPELFYECDAFLVQCKSCLDHLVKLPRPFFGECWSLTTFGSHGRDVVNAIHRNLPAKFAGSAKGLLMLMEQHEGWLGPLIRSRDKINHLQEGGVAPETFSVFAVRSPLERSKCTLRNGRPTRRL